MRGAFRGARKIRKPFFDRTSFALGNFGGIIFSKRYLPGARRSSRKTSLASRSSVSRIFLGNASRPLVESVMVVVVIKGRSPHPPRLARQITPVGLTSRARI